MKNEQTAQFNISQNVEYQVRQANGSVKPLFAMNFLGNLFLRIMRFLVYEPIDETGQVKKGTLNHLAAYGLQIPLITGNFTDKLCIHNIVTDAGLAAFSGRIGLSTIALFNYIAVGTGTTAAAAADTELEAEITDSGLERAAGTISQVTTTVDDDTIQATKTFTVSGSKTVAESGLLNAAADGTLGCRQVMAAVSLVSSDQFIITWKIKAARAD